MKLVSGSRVAVIGGGPAGSFFGYFLLDMSARLDITIAVDIYEPRDFLRSGPPGCNMCAGVVSEALIQTLAAEGLNLPASVVQRGIDSYVLHTDVGSTRIESVRHEKRIAATFRGLGPHGIEDTHWKGLDNHLLNQAVGRGARHIPSRVDRVEWLADPDNSGDRSLHPQLIIHDGTVRTYDLLAIATGVNTPILKQLQSLDTGYIPPRTTKCLVREYYLGEAAIAEYLGDSMHTFLLNIPRLEFAALVPKGHYVTLVMLGENINQDMLQTLLAAPALRACFPPDFPLEEVVCQCGPRINIQGSIKPYSDRLVFVGDSSVARLYKDGIGSAFRTAKAAASTAIFQGIAEEDFRRHYWPICRAIKHDNAMGKAIFSLVRQIQKTRFSRQAILHMVAREQQHGSPIDGGMTMVLWDMFTGSASYKGILVRILQPAVFTQFLWALIASLWPFNRESSAQRENTPALVNLLSKRDRDLQDENMEQAGALGKVYGPGEVIIRQGEAGDTMHVIQEGQVEVIVERDGKEIQLAVRGEGELIGEMAIFERENRMATVRALGYARLLTVERQMLLHRIYEDPTLGLHLIQAMSRRIRDLSGEVLRLRKDQQAPESYTISRIQE